jgi:hypothetical protein
MQFKFIPVFVFLTVSFTPAIAVYLLGTLKETIEFYAAWQHLLIVLREGLRHS